MPIRYVDIGISVVVVITLGIINYVVFKNIHNPMNKLNLGFIAWVGWCSYSFVRILIQQIMY